MLHDIGKLCRYLLYVIPHHKCYSKTVSRLAFGLVVMVIQVDKSRATISRIA